MHWLIVLAAKILKTCPYWDRLNPVYRDRPCMVPPHSSSNMDGADDALALLMNGDTNSQMEGVEDAYLQADHGDSNVEQDERETSPDEGFRVVSPPPEAVECTKRKASSTAEKIKSGKRSGSKGVSVGEVLMTLGQEQVKLQARKQAMDEKNMESVRELNIWKMEKEKEELEIRKAEMEVRKMEAENKRMEIQFQMEMFAKK